MSIHILHRPTSDVDDQSSRFGLMSGTADDRHHSYDDGQSPPDQVEVFVAVVCLFKPAYPDSSDDKHQDPVSRFYQQDQNFVLDGWRLHPAFTVELVAVQIVVIAFNTEVAR